MTIKTGKNASKPPSIASLYRALADAEDTPPAPVDQAAVLRPKPAKIRRAGEPLTPEELDLRRRVIAGRAAITDEDD